MVMFEFEMTAVASGVVDGKRRKTPFSCIAFPRDMAIFEFENDGRRHLEFLNTQNFNHR